MGDVVVTRADRECAADALGWDIRDPQLHYWLRDGGQSVEHDDEYKSLRPSGSMETRGMYRENRAAQRFARVRIAAERAGYERGVREERGRCVSYLRNEATSVRANSAAWQGVDGEDFSNDVADLIGDFADDLEGA